MNAPNADHLLASILAKQGELDVLANDLLSAVRAGLPIEKLRVLLENEDDDLVKVGVWVQSELGAAGRPLVHLLPQLLRHRLKYVRFFAIDSVLGCATQDDVELIAEVLQRIHDPEPSVRWKVIDFLSRVPLPHLRATEAFLRRTDAGKEAAASLQRFGESFGVGTEALLTSKVADDRRFGLALAMRHRDRRALELAANSSDDEVKEIAAETLKRV